MGPKNVLTAWRPGRRTRRVVAIDLFSGCGGLTLGLKRAGFRVLGAVDSDDLAVESYKFNHRGICVWTDDIRRLPARKVASALRLRQGRLDLLAGCPPCQGFSSVRRRNGPTVRDPRNDLLFEFLRYVRVLKPKAVMMENVPGLAATRRMAAFCATLRRLGYSVYCDILDAAKYGVPQHRRRMILLGSRWGPVDPPEPDPAARTVREAIGRFPKPGRSGDPLHDFPERHGPEVARLIAAIPKNGGGRLDLAKSLRLRCHRRFDGFKDVYGRMAWDHPGPTITGGCVKPSKGRFLHPEADRAITLREAALLQSFPAGYRISLRQGKNRAAELIGNALPPEFIRRVASAIFCHLKGR